MTTIIDALEAGEELDALIAEKYFGWVKLDDGWNARGTVIWHTPEGTWLPLLWIPKPLKFSTEWLAAMTIIRRLIDNGELPSMIYKSILVDSLWTLGWEVHIRRTDVYGWAVELAHAICLAVLRMVLNEHEDD